MTKKHSPHFQKNGNSTKKDFFGMIQKLNLLNK